MLLALTRRMTLKGTNLRQRTALCAPMNLKVFWHFPAAVVDLAIAPTNAQVVQYVIMLYLLSLRYICIKNTVNQ